MKRTPQQPLERAQCALDLVTVKELWRDVLFREAGQAYFKRFAVPRRRRWLGPWRTLPTYQAERQLLPVGGRETHRLIEQFFTTYACLRAEFHADGMPITAIRVLRQCCPALNVALTRIYSLECVPGGDGGYQIALTGGPASPLDTQEYGSLPRGCPFAPSPPGNMSASIPST
jgi:hypothetical protein